MPTGSEHLSFTCLHVSYLSKAAVAFILSLLFGVGGGTRLDSEI